MELKIPIKFSLAYLTFEKSRFLTFLRSTSRATDGREKRVLAPVEESVELSSTSENDSSDETDSDF